MMDNEKNIDIQEYTPIKLLELLGYYPYKAKIWLMEPTFEVEFNDNGNLELSNPETTTPHGYLEIPLNEIRIHYNYPIITPEGDYYPEDNSNNVPTLNDYPLNPTDRIKLIFGSIPFYPFEGVEVPKSIKQLSVRDVRKYLETIIFSDYENRMSFVMGLDTDERDSASGNKILTGITKIDYSYKHEGDIVLYGKVKVIERKQ